MEKLYEIRSSFKSFFDDESGNHGTGLSVYQPEEKTERAHIAILAFHSGSYMSFKPMVGMAERGFVAAGMSPKFKDFPGFMKEVNAAVNYLKSIPGVEKVVLMGHSQGGCVLSGYQYIAENGTDRFKNTDRAIPFADIEPLTPADGIILTDANYGIMSMLALDPAVRLPDSGYSRIPELDMFNPENGYKPGGSTFTDEFIRRFERAQVKMYKDILNYCKERKVIIEAGRGRFIDDEPLVIAGASGGSSNNKPFCMDIRLLGQTAGPRLLLHPDGTLTETVVHTVRTPVDSVPSSKFAGGAVNTTVMTFLKNEMKFDDDFGFNESKMWGDDGVFNPSSTRENVKGITVPLLCQGNTASHEFVNMDMTFDNAISKDKEIFMSEGACHSFAPVAPQYKGILDATCDMFAKWLSKPGRFI